VRVSRESRVDVAEIRGEKMRMREADVPSAESPMLGDVGSLAVSLSFRSPFKRAVVFRIR